MQKYEMDEAVGDGSFGTVVKARARDTGEYVAIKRLKRTFATWSSCLQLKEVKALRRTSHPNCVKLKEVVRARDILYLIQEYAPHSLASLIDRAYAPGGEGIAERNIRRILYQLLQGVQHLHQVAGFFHRDLKPDNILLTDADISKAVLKIADFGLARQVRSAPPFTNYVATRWYRAPECVFEARSYGPPVDLFAIGCIAVELFTGRPLLPGTSALDQVIRMARFFGSEELAAIPAAGPFMRANKISLPPSKPTQITSVLPNHTSQQAIDLIVKLLHPNEQLRLSAHTALAHPYFDQIGRTVPRMLSTQLSLTPRKQKSLIDKSRLEQPSPFLPPVKKQSSRDLKDVIIESKRGIPEENKFHQSSSVLPHHSLYSNVSIAIPRPPPRANEILNKIESGNTSYDYSTKKESQKSIFPDIMEDTPSRHQGFMQHLRVEEESPYRQFATPEVQQSIYSKRASFLMDSKEKETKRLSEQRSLAQLGRMNIFGQQNDRFSFDSPIRASKFKL